MCLGQGILSFFLSTGKSEKGVVFWYTYTEYE